MRRSWFIPTPPPPLMHDYTLWKRHYIACVCQLHWNPPQVCHPLLLFPAVHTVSPPLLFPSLTSLPPVPPQAISLSPFFFTIAFLLSHLYPFPISSHHSFLPFFPSLQLPADDPEEDQHDNTDAMATEELERSRKIKKKRTRHILSDEAKGPWRDPDPHPADIQYCYKIDSATYSPLYSRSVGGGGYTYWIGPWIRK